MTLATLPLPGVALRAAASSLDKCSGKVAVSEAASEATHGSRLHPFGDTSRRRRLVKVLAWLIGVAVAIVVLDLLGVNVTGWFAQLWDQIAAVPVKYILAGVTLQTGQTFFAGLSYYGILRAAYGEGCGRPGRDGLRSRRRDERLPACEHRHLRHPADVRCVIPSCTFAGAIAAYLVQKIFFHRRHLRVPLPLPLGARLFDSNLGNISAHPVLTIAIILGVGS